MPPTSARENVMPQTHPRSIAATASGLAGCLLLAACGSSSPTHAHTSAGPPHRTAANSSPAATAGSNDTPFGSSSPTSGTSTAARPAAARNACTLITEHDVTTAAGHDPSKGTGDTRQGASGCIYGSYPNPVLSVNILPGRGRASYDHIRHDPRLTSTTGTSVATVPAVGDQAFELSGPHNDAIYFTHGDELIVIGFTAPSTPPKGAALTLAKLAASRL